MKYKLIYVRIYTQMLLEYIFFCFNSSLYVAHLDNYNGVAILINMNIQMGDNIKNGEERNNN